jgi:peptide/nickel transport system substrate-binding protein
MRRSTWAVLMAGVLLSGVATAAGKVLRVGVSTGVKSSEFTTKHDEVTGAVLHHVYEPLVAYRDDMSIGPMVAERYEVSNDGKTYTFKIREGIVFHNGAPVTSAEVKWTWNRYLSRDWGDRCRGHFDGSEEIYLRPSHVLSVEAPDPRTVVFRLASPNGLFLHQMASNYCITGILHPDSVNADGSWKQPIATGPYQLTSWEKDGAAVLTRFAGYKPRKEPMSGLAGAKEAKLDELRFVPFPDRQSLAQGLIEGKVDVLLDLNLEAYDSMKSKQGVVLYPQERLAWQQLLIQTRHDPLLRDPKLRQAIAYAIDREKITKIVAHGLVQPNPSAVARRSPYHTAAQDVSLGYNPDRAKALLRESGYQGQPITIQASRAPYEVFYQSAVLAAEMLNAVGINAVVKEVDWATQDKNYGANEFQITSMSFSMRTDPALMYSAIIGQKTDHKWYLWEDSEADLWTGQAAYASDPAQRQRLFDQIHAKMIDSTPTIGLYNNFRIDVSSDKVQGYKTHPMGIPRFWGVTVR